MSASELRSFSIETEQEAYNLLSDLLKNKINADEISVNFASAKWARFALTLDGDEFHSSLPTNIMKSLVEYQTTIYRIAAYIKNDKLNGNALSDDIKDNLELNFRISGGCSDIVAEVVKPITEMVREVTEGMGTRAKLIIVLSVLLTAFGSFTLPPLIQSKTGNCSPPLGSAA